MAEERITNTVTGAEKGRKDERYDLIPVGPLAELARLYGAGAKKYPPRNWERGYDWSLSYAALQRHANAWWGGEEMDPETGTSHMAAVAWHAFALMQFAVEHRELDDRAPRYANASKPENAAIPNAPMNVHKEGH